VTGAAKLAQCEQLKEKGNAVFKAGEYERAFRRYTTAKTLADSDQDLSAEDKTAAAALKLTLLNKWLGLQLIVQHRRALSRAVGVREAERPYPLLCSRLVDQGCSVSLWFGNRRAPDKTINSLTSSC